MPSPVPLPIRQAKWRRRERGATATELSQAFGIPPRTVRGLLRRWRDRGEAALAPDYTRRRDPPQAPAHPAFEAAMQPRRDPPGWGAGLIRVYLAERGLRPPPGETTLRRWFRRAGGRRARLGERPSPMRPGRSMPPSRSRWATAPGPAGCGSSTSSAARRSGPRFSPLGRWEAVPAAETQADLRRAFARWGLPRRVRVDNGTPWGSTGELPTALGLWLIGLGLEMTGNPPRCPEANGVVERPQGPGKRWAEPPTCGDAAKLQRRLDEQDRIQRELYPSIAGRSRWEAFPELRPSGRTYRPEGEASGWELGRVLGHLAEYVLVRRVDGGGTIPLYNRSRYVGKALAGRDVHVTLDPVEVEWVYASREGVCYHRQKAEELTAERILGRDVSRHRERTQLRRPSRVAGFPAEPPER